MRNGKQINYRTSALIHWLSVESFIVTHSLDKYNVEKDTAFSFQESCLRGEIFDTGLVSMYTSTSRIHHNIRVLYSF